MPLSEAQQQRIEVNCPGWKAMSQDEMALVLDRLIHENITFRNTTASASQTTDKLLELLRAHRAVSVPQKVTKSTCFEPEPKPKSDTISINRYLFIIMTAFYLLGFALHLLSSVLYQFTAR